MVAMQIMISDLIIFQLFTLTLTKPCAVVIHMHNYVQLCTRLAYYSKYNPRQYRTSVTYMTICKSV